ncbi:MAG: hypothetical protein WB509_02660 [Acetobacteraceae bacterium]
MADRDDAKFLEVVGRQTGKNYRRYVILAECRRVLSKPLLSQPIRDLHRHPPAWRCS